MNFQYYIENLYMSFLQEIAMLSDISFTELQAREIVTPLILQDESKGDVVVKQTDEEGISKDKSQDI